MSIIWKKFSKMKPPVANWFSQPRHLLMLAFMLVAYKPTMMTGMMRSGKAGYTNEEAPPLAHLLHSFPSQK
jgi:hypothetical protein